ncbi:MAG: DUF2779 domain-containing protein [Pseudomonadota bacterium]
MLTKSDLLSYIQCPKRLWLEKHRANDIPPPDKDMLRRATDGNLVGEKARELLGEAKLWPKSTGDMATSAAKAWADIRAGGGKPAVEVPMVNGDLYARADAVLPTQGGFVLRETKASSFPLKPDKVTPAGPESHHVDDLAIQAWAMEGSGEQLARTELNLLNGRWRYPGGGDYSGLFRQLDVTEAVSQRVKDIPIILQSALHAVAGEIPHATTGPHCDRPYECPFKKSCAASEPPRPEHPVELLPDSAGKKLAGKLRAQKGYLSILEPASTELVGAQSALYQRIQLAHRSGKPVLEVGAKAIVEALSYPRFYFDFEGIDLPVPRWAGTRPYEQVVFQWSCHVERSPGVFEHAAFLDLSGGDPSLACAERMREVLGTVDGPIIVYHATYEKTRFRELGERHPELVPLMDSYTARIFDLLPVVKAHFYHPSMRGSFSIKKVLPVIAPDLNYQVLEGVSGGTDAQIAYLHATSGKCNEEESTRIRSELLRYCAQDTWAMVEVAYFLAGRPRPTRPG